MPQFAFAARDRGGRPQRGVLAADSSMQLAAQLRGRGWLVTEIRDAGAHGPRLTDFAAALAPSRWLPATRLDVELGAQQMATMLRSGLTLLSALRTAAEQSRRPAMARVWRLAAERVEEGSTFANALRGNRRLFPPLVIQLVRIGEESGTLDVVMTRAATQLEKARAVRTMLLTSLMYPAFVLAAAVGVALFMVLHLIPRLEKFLTARGGKLPAISQALLDLTTWINSHGTLILLCLAACLTAGWLIYRIPWTRARVDRALLRVPIIGGLLRLAGTATLARALSILVESGVSLLSALQTIRDAIGNRAMRARVESARSAVLEGGGLADRFLAGREFMPMLGRMVAVGEETSTLGAVLSEVADFHESQLALAVRRLSMLVEPATIVFVGGIVGFVYIAFFMALFSLAGGR